MAVNNSQYAETGIELATVTLTGGVDLIGAGILLHNPVMIIFDNQSAVPIAIYHNQTTDIWRTFPAGEALVLDMRAAHGLASNYTFRIGDTFYAQGAAGANVFSISYTYAKDL